MIANANELEIAFRSVQLVENALNALRKEMQTTTPALFPIVSQTYTRRIHDLQEDISTYLRENPAAAPLKKSEETVQGILVSIDIERNTCKIRPEGEQLVSCGHDDQIEDDLIVAVKKHVEVSGIIEGASRNSDARRIKHIERLRVLNPDEEEL